MDDNHTYLKKDYVEEVHNNLNSVNPNRYSLLRRLKKTAGFSLDFTTIKVYGEIQVSV